jgi:hypothetical protein
MTRFRSDVRCGPELRAAALRANRAVTAGRGGAKPASASALLLAAVLLAAVLISAAAQAAPQVGERVALTACPHAGITAPCPTINGADGAVYNIAGATAKPPLNGRMIRLRGTVSDKLSTCLQGTVLDRIRWTPVRQKCSN